MSSLLCTCAAGLWLSKCKPLHLFNSKYLFLWWWRSWGTLIHTTTKSLWRPLYLLEVFPPLSGLVIWQRTAVPLGGSLRRIFPSGRKPPRGLPGESHVCKKRKLSLHWMDIWFQERSSSWWWEQRPDPSSLPSVCCPHSYASPPSYITHYSDNGVFYNTTFLTIWKERSPFFKFFSLFVF